MQNVQVGDLLVSSSLVDGSVLNQAVCLLVYEDSDHAIGLMLNRPMKPIAVGGMNPGNLPTPSTQAPSSQTPSSPSGSIPRWKSVSAEQPIQPFDSQPPEPTQSGSNPPAITILGDDNDPLAQKLIAGGNGTSLHFGGPLSGPVVAVHSTRALAEAQAGEGIFVAAQREHLEALLKNKAEPFRLIIGHLGWTHDQLYNEIDDGIWHRIPSSPDILSSDDASMWPRLIRRATSNSVARWLNTTDVPTAAELN